MKPKKETQKIHQEHKKPLCELTGCPSMTNKTIEIRPIIDRFISGIHKDNPGANPLCIKRIASKLLREESARLFVEIVERDK